MRSVGCRRPSNTSRRNKSQPTCTHTRITRIHTDRTGLHTQGGEASQPDVSCLNCICLSVRRVSGGAPCLHGLEAVDERAHLLPSTAKPAAPTGRLPGYLSLLWLLVRFLGWFLCCLCRRRQRPRDHPDTLTGTSQYGWNEAEVRHAKARRHTRQTDDTLADFAACSWRISSVPLATARTITHRGLTPRSSVPL